MVDETIMTRNNGNGKASPLAAVAKDFQHVAHDVVELAELQATLVKAELQGWWKQFIMPIVLFGLAAVLATCCLIILLHSAGLQLAESADISLALAMLIVGASGLLLAGILGGIGYGLVKKFRPPLPESKREFSRNLRWIKTVLKEVRHPAARQQYIEDPS